MPTIGESDIGVDAVGVGDAFAVAAGSTSGEITTATDNPYLNLIPSQNERASKFVATVAAVTQPMVDLQASYQEAVFDLDTSVGDQLDKIGQWVGFSRNISTSLNLYFSFDTSGLGFDQGNIFAPEDPATGLTALDDGTYRTLLRAKIGANAWDGTLATMNALLAEIFSTLGITAAAADNQDMTMTVYFFGNQPSAILTAVLNDGYLSLKPEGVLITGFVYVVNSLFGFDVENQIVSGFDVGHLSATS